MYGEAAGQAASFVEDDAFTATMSMNVKGYRTLRTPANTD
jgi:hypothetical protein